MKLNGPCSTARSVASARSSPYRPGGLPSRPVPMQTGDT